MADRLRVEGEGITLDLILWRRHGVRGRRLVEPALALNPGLAGACTVLPLGTEIVLPELSEVAAPPPRPVISLFG
ncbi:MAG: tail protein X [Mesorhizobium sp.]|nr:tail protein X [Mesorhizobium sp.]